MKNITILFLFVISFGSFAQENIVENKFTDNQKRLTEIPFRVQEAIAIENYKEAADLQEEMEIRKRIEVAISNKEHARVVELEKILADGKYKLISVRKFEENNEKSYGPKRHSFYLDFIPTGFASSRYKKKYGINESVNQTDFYALIGLNLGSTIFFGDMKKDFKIGLDISYLSFTMGIREYDLYDFGPSFYVTLMQPGIVMTKFFNKNNGVDMKVNAGLIGTSSVNFNSTGFSISTNIKYWKKRFAVGLEYRYGYAPINKNMINQLNLLIGLRF